MSSGGTLAGRSSGTSCSGFSTTSVNFRRVLQYQTRDAFNSDYNALELSAEKRWPTAGPGVSATPWGARDVKVAGTLIEKRVNDDRNPRLDYGLANLDNRHAFTAGGNWQAWRGLGVGATFSYYSGNPANETVGTDVNATTTAPTSTVR
jgi:hypothetical protein